MVRRIPLAFVGLKRTGEEWVHRWLLIEEVGEPLSTFRSKKELVGAFIDVIEGINLLLHEDMWLTR